MNEMNIIVNILLWISYVVSLYFTIFLLLVYLDKRSVFKAEYSSLRLKKHPFVSILVPAHNEENTIVKTLNSLAELDYPKDHMEVIVVNDGSWDATARRVEEFIQQSGRKNFTLISFEKNKGKAAALNYGLQKAKGAFFACLDADSFVEKETLRKMLSLYEREDEKQQKKGNQENTGKSPLAIVTPAMKVYRPQGLLQKIQWIEYTVMIFFSRLASHIDSLYVAPGPFSLYRTEYIRQLGGFDENTLTEDQEIAYRVQKKQFWIRQCFDGYVFTTAPAKILQFYRQRRRWYLGSLTCLYQYKGMIAKKRYGDFGMMQLVKNVVGYLLTFTGLGLAMYFFLQPFLMKLKNLFLVHFDLLFYLKQLKTRLLPSVLDLLLTDFRAVFIVLFLSCIGIFFFYLAHKNAQEKFAAVGALPLLPYALFYYLLKGSIFLLSLAQFARSKKIKW